MLVEAHSTTDAATETAHPFLTSGPRLEDGLRWCRHSATRHAIDAPLPSTRPSALGGINRGDGATATVTAAHITSAEWRARPSVAARPSLREEPRGGTRGESVLMSLSLLSTLAPPSSRLEPLPPLPPAVAPHQPTAHAPAPPTHRNDLIRQIGRHRQNGGPVLPVPLNQGRCEHAIASPGPGPRCLPFSEASVRRRPPSTTRGPQATLPASVR